MTAQGEGADAPGKPTPALGRIAVALLLVSPLRIALGCAVLVAVRVAMADSTPAVLGFVALASGTFFVVLDDPRRRFRRRRQGSSLPMPADVRFVSRGELLRSAVFPSTLGLTALAVISIATGKDTLAACLGGVLAGLGLASLAAGLRVLRREKQEGCEYYAEPHGSRVFERRNSSLER